MRDCSTRDRENSEGFFYAGRKRREGGDGTRKGRKTMSIKKKKKKLQQKKAKRRVAKANTAPKADGLTSKQCHLVTFTGLRQLQGEGESSCGVLGTPARNYREIKAGKL
jgi:hypothetical protein